MTLTLAWQLNAGAELQSCHIHPPGSARQSELETGPFYSSLHQCESANRKIYGGTGRCHCFPKDFMNRDGFDGWRLRPWDLEAPPERVP